jgi:hypothetical protein
MVCSNLGARHLPNTDKAASPNFSTVATLTLQPSTPLVTPLTIVYWSASTRSRMAIDSS